MLAVTVVCGPDDEQAERMAAPIRPAVVRNRMGRRAPIASTEEALAYRFTREEEAIADKLMLSALVPDRGDRLQSCERVSSAAGLS